VNGDEDAEEHKTSEQRLKHGDSITTHVACGKVDVCVPARIARGFATVGSMHLTFLRSRSLWLSSTLATLVAVSGCSKLSSTEVTSGDGRVRVHAPKGAWQCAKNDVEEGAGKNYTQSGVKCRLDDVDGAVILNAKLYDVDTAEATTAEVFCIQDWPAAYKNVFAAVTSWNARVTEWHKLKVCELTMEGLNPQRGPSTLWEVRAPNGIKMLQVTVGGTRASTTKNKEIIDAWLEDVRADMLLAPQKPASQAQAAPPSHAAGADLTMPASNPMTTSPPAEAAPAPAPGKPVSTTAHANGW
jgi:hypothetical protein